MYLKDVPYACIHIHMYIYIYNMYTSIYIYIDIYIYYVNMLFQDTISTPSRRWLFLLVSAPCALGRLHVRIGCLQLKEACNLRKRVALYPLKLVLV